ncbi:LL-diaminopimelate aminotransferase [archaeon]|nr:LL-diaminopimelate aminotransferase [archaeon]
MVKINNNYDKLGAGYLFPEIARRTKLFLANNPQAKVMRLGIGNTTEALTPTIIDGLKTGVANLSDIKTYSGYGDEQGNTRLREALANHFSKKGIQLQTNEIFVSDGAKSDSANIQSIFGFGVVAVQDPSYPVYVDTNVIAGRTEEYDESSGQYKNILYMPCVAENGFFPEVPKGKVDLIYLCSPNNPTGAVATKEQLKGFVDYAIENKAVLIFDSAYASFVSDSNLPTSIYEIPRAKECAIEIGSFSKSAGFTGVRLGYTIVPMDLVVEDTVAGKVNSLWNRRQTTFFNGASNIAQMGGIAALSEEGLKESQEIIDYYMENARIIKKCIESIGLKAYGGVNAPYIWLATPNNMSSWDFFDKLLNETHVVGTPGIGFGPNGEGYFRLSAFGHRDDIKQAVESIVNNLKI